MWRIYLLITQIKTITITNLCMCLRFVFSANATLTPLFPAIKLIKHLRMLNSAATSEVKSSSICMANFTQATLCMYLHICQFIYSRWCYNCPLSQMSWCIDHLLQVNSSEREKFNLLLIIYCLQLNLINLMMHVLLVSSAK